MKKICLSNVGVFSSVRDIIFCYLSAKEGYYDTCGLCHQDREGTQITKNVIPHGTHDIPHGIEHPRGTLLP